jgi:subtilisin family serine protease
MRRLFLLVIVVLGWAFPVAAQDTDRILVTFADPGMSNAARAGPPRPGYNRRTSTYLISQGVKRAADKVAREFGLEVVDEWPILPLNVHCLVYQVPAGTGVESLLDKLRERPEVESAQPMNTFEVSGEVVHYDIDPYTKLQHNLGTLELISAHAWSRGGGTSVTIIDTGADINQPELRTQISTHHDFTGISDFADDAHGTAVAGVIGAASGNGIGMTGIAPDADLTVLRACWYTDGKAKAVCDSFTLAKALTHALESDTDVINLSLAGPHDPLLGRILSLALDNGIVVVAAAAKTPGFPASVPGVIVVDSQVDETAEAAQLVAPGEGILVPVPGGGFDYASGSSLSAAHVSGVAALLIAQRPGLGRDDLKMLLVDSQVPDGLSINACRALATLLELDGCRGDATAQVVP